MDKACSKTGKLRVHCVEQTEHQIIADKAAGRVGDLRRNAAPSLYVGDISDEPLVGYVEDGILVVRGGRVDADAREDVRHRVHGVLLVNQRFFKDQFHGFSTGCRGRR